MLDNIKHEWYLIKRIGWSIIEDSAATADPNWDGWNKQGWATNSKE